MEIVTRIILDWPSISRVDSRSRRADFGKKNYIEFAPWFQYTYAFFKFREFASASFADTIRYPAIRRQIGRSNTSPQES